MFVFGVNQPLSNGVIGLGVYFHTSLPVESGDGLCGVTSVRETDAALVSGAGVGGPVGVSGVPWSSSSVPGSSGVA